MTEAKPVSEGTVVDILVPLFAAGESGRGCRMSEEFRAGDFVAAALEVCGAGPGRAVKDLLVDELDASRHVGYAVFLATDGVYRNDRFVADESHLVVSNEYVMDIARRNARVLFGASVHPYREAKEMVAETSRCIDGGAALFNWVPSIQRIDPEDDRCIPFYLRIAQEGVPLLCHSSRPYCGVKSAYVNMEYNNPHKLRRALDIGVKVIVSLCGSGLGGRWRAADLEFGDELLHMLRTAGKKGWDLYADISALNSSAEKLHFERAREEILGGDMSTARYVFGSGIPLRTGVCRPSQGENLFDRSYRMLRDAGLPESVFTHAGDVIRFPREHERIAAIES